MEAEVRIDAEPEVTVSPQTRPNCTSWLLKSENASAVNMTKNSVIDWVFPPVLILATLISTNSYNGLFNDCAGILGDNDGMKSILVLEDVQNSALSIAR